MRVDPALATLVPADTAVLVGAKLDKLRETQVYQKHFAKCRFRGWMISRNKQDSIRARTCGKSCSHPMESSREC